MALYIKMFAWSYSIIVPNFKFVSQSARFGQNFTPTTPTTIGPNDTLSAAGSMSSQAARAVRIAALEVHTQAAPARMLL